MLTRYSIAAVPMGWVSTVGLCQHAHRRMLLTLPRSVTPPSSSSSSRAGTAEPLVGDVISTFDVSAETQRDRALPSGPWTFRIYIDNYDEIEFFPCTDGLALVGTRSASSERSERQYAAWDSVGNPEKEINRPLLMDSLSLRTDGPPGLAPPTTSATCSP